MTDYNDMDTFCAPPKWDDLPDWIQEDICVALRTQFISNVASYFEDGSAQSATHADTDNADGISWNSLFSSACSETNMINALLHSAQNSFLVTPDSVFETPADDAIQHLEFDMECSVEAWYYDIIESQTKILQGALIFKKGAGKHKIKAYLDKELIPFKPKHWVSG